MLCFTQQLVILFDLSSFVLNYCTFSVIMSLNICKQTVSIQTNQLMKTLRNLEYLGPDGMWHYEGRIGSEHLVLVFGERVWTWRVFSEYSQLLIYSQLPGSCHFTHKLGKQNTFCNQCYG